MILWYNNMNIISIPFHDIFLTISFDWFHFSSCDNTSMICIFSMLLCLMIPFLLPWLHLHDLHLPHGCTSSMILLPPDSSPPWHCILNDASWFFSSTLLHPQWSDSIHNLPPPPPCLLLLLLQDATSSTIWFSPSSCLLNDLTSWFPFSTILPPPQLALSIIWAHLWSCLSPLSHIPHKLNSSLLLFPQKRAFHTHTESLDSEYDDKSSGAHSPLGKDGIICNLNSGENLKLFFSDSSRSPEESVNLNDSSMMDQCSQTILWCLQ